MDEGVLHRLGFPKSCNYWGIRYLRWRKISSIHRTTCYTPARPPARPDHVAARLTCFPSERRSKLSESKKEVCSKWLYRCCGMQNCGVRKLPQAKSGPSLRRELLFQGSGLVGSFLDGSGETVHCYPRVAAVSTLSSHNEYRV